MSDTSRPRAVLDTDIIYSCVLHDLMGRIARRLRLIDLFWSEELLAEARTSLEQKKRLPPEATRRWVDYLPWNFPNGGIDLDEPPAVPDLASLSTDPADAHVCALAIAASADYLFTHDRGYLSDGRIRGSSHDAGARRPSRRKKEKHGCGFWRMPGARSERRVLDVREPRPEPRQAARSLLEHLPSQDEEFIMSDRPVFIYAATYADAASAEGDYDLLLELHAVKLVGTYDVALVTKDADGKVHVEKHEKPTQHGAWGGIAVGAAVGVLAAPAVVPAALLGGVIGGLGGHFKKGIARDDAKELGDLIDAGQATLLVIGESRLEEQLDKALTRAEKTIEKEIDVDSKEFKRELDEAEKEYAAS